MRKVNNMREQVDFNENWYFLLGDQEDYAKQEYDEKGFKKVRLPHDWSIEYELHEDAPSGGGGGYAVTGTGWYRKHFQWKKPLSPKQVYLLFEGIYMDSAVFLNGEKVGGHIYGYSSFPVDLTGKLKEGENVIAVRVDNSRQPNSRWYSGSGITRNVWLVTTEQIHLELWGVKCDTNGIYPEQDQASLQIQAYVQNDSKEAVYAGVIHRLYDREGTLAASCGSGVYLMPGESGCCMARPSVDHPHLWTDEDPYLYTMESTVVCGEQPVDAVTGRIGIRTAVFDCDRGFLLNGRQVKIKGMCVHHDCGITGAAGCREIWERRLSRLKDMGCNGIRCAHNPPDPVVLDLCDELGFLVMDEIFDEWMLTKNKTNNYYSQSFAYGFGLYFDKNAKEELVTMLRRDYNHPSVILWSIGNEIPEQSSADGVKLLNFLKDICHQEDSCRMVTAACDNIGAAEPMRSFREFENALDVVGYNYVGRWRERAETFYEQDRLAFPKRRMIGSENPGVGGVRGNYSEDGVFKPYMRATMQHESLWRYTISHDFVAGDYLWTGIDYLGETRWPARGASSGALDTAGFCKDSYYYFRSIWNREEITLHLLPHWNWHGEEGNFKQVICYTNCEEVRLFINGRLVGNRGYECPRYGAVKAWNDCMGKRHTTNDLHLSWDVPYEPGVLRAEGYRNQELVAVTEVVTTKEPAALEAEPDHTLLKKGGLVQIELSCVDEDGRIVPDAAPLVFCSVEGPLHLMGMDSGDLHDLSLYSCTQRRMLAGRLLAVLRADEAGEARVTFTAPGLAQQTIALRVE